MFALPNLCVKLYLQKDVLCWFCSFLQLLAQLLIPVREVYPNIRSLVCILRSPWSISTGQWHDQMIGSAGGERNGKVLSQEAWEVSYRVNEGWRCRGWVGERVLAAEEGDGRRQSCQALPNRLWRTRDTEESRTMCMFLFLKPTNDQTENYVLITFPVLLWPTGSS